MSVQPEFENLSKDNLKIENKSEAKFPSSNTSSIKNDIKVKNKKEIKEEDKKNQIMNNLIVEKQELISTIHFYKKSVQ